VTPGDWPATLIFRSRGGGCTSTAVGPKVILTAAHCIPDGESGQVTIGGQAVAIRCDHHPGYGAGNRTTDFALCAVTEGEIANVPFEVVGTALAHARLDQTVTLSGYGCLEENGQDRNFGVLHVGTAKVIRTPIGDDIDTVTSGGAALCFGDSGGPAYFDAGDGERLIIGVNSRGDISEMSWLSSTATAQFVDWAFKWSETNNASICGLHVATMGCRS
jgi:hypothetical protein